MSDNDESPGKYFGDSLQLTNWILDSGATWHITPQVLDFIPGSLEDTDKNIEVADGHHVTAKQKEKLKIKMCNDTSETDCNIAQRTFDPRSMRKIILNYCVNEFGTYLFISQRVLYSVIRLRGDKYGYFTT